MRAGRSESAVALIVGAAALLLTCVFGFLTFTPGVDPGVGGFLQLGFFGGGVVTMGAFITYFVMSRRSSRGDAPSKFERLLDQRRAALGAVPVGLAAVLVGALWYLTRMLGNGGGVDVPDALAPATQSFQAIDTAGITAFLGFGSLYVIVASYLAIRAERAAIQVARLDAEVAR